MQKHKFDETDRDKVISEIERHFDTKLSRFGRRKKVLQDPSGKSYWILGGYDDWHGVTSDMVKEEETRATDGVLVIAKRHKTTIDIFVGPLRPLIANSPNLSHVQKGDYQFNISIRGNSMTIREVPELMLRKLGASQDVGLAVSSQAKEVEGMLAKLSLEERLKLLEQLSGGS